MSQNESIEFACPNCNIGLKIQVQFAGVTGPCPQCQAEITAPHPATAAQSAFTIGAAVPPLQSQLPPQSGSVPQESPDQRVTPPPGNPPHRQPFPPPPQPQPQVASQAKMQALAPIRTGRRTYWPTIIIPALFLILAVILIYLILNFLGILKSYDDPEKSAVTSISTLENAPAPIKPTLPAFDPAKTQDPAPAPFAIDPGQPLEHDPRDNSKPGEVPAELPDLTFTNNSIESAADDLSSS